MQLTLLPKTFFNNWHYRALMLKGFLYTMGSSDKAPDYGLGTIQLSKLDLLVHFMHQRWGAFGHPVNISETAQAILLVWFKKGSN